MKPTDKLVKENMKNLKPCVHGAEVLGAANQTGYNPWEIVDFSSSVNPLGPSKKALAAAKDAFKQIPAYPDSNSTELRQVIASHYDIKKENIIIGNGSTELMYLFSEVFLKPGDFAVMPAPTFGEYEGAVAKTGERTKFVKLTKTNQLDEVAFLREMVDAKIVFLCNPNNPTSKLIPKRALAGIVEAALANDTLVFLDEDFLEFVDNEKNLTFIGSISKYPNLFLLRSFTKIYGLTGLRVGYGIADSEIIRPLSCAKIPWNINCIAQSAAATALQDEAHLNVTRKLIKKEKRYLSNELAKFESFSFEEPDANFYFINIQKTGQTAAQLKNSLLKKSILIRDCTSFRDLDKYHVRIAVKTHQENVRLIEALQWALKS